MWIPVRKAYGLILDNISYIEPFTKQTNKSLRHPEVFSENKKIKASCSFELNF